MTQALATVSETAALDVSAIDLATFQAQVLPHEFVGRYLSGADIPPEGLEEEVRHCFMLMKQTRLNPFLRQIHFVPKHDKRLGRQRLVTITGIDGYRLLAERTGERDGEEPPQWCGRDGRWRDCWADQGPPVACRVAVYRQGFSRAFWGVCHHREYAGNTSLWQTMPAQMLAKCAEALAIRKAFPLETAGIYTDAEMDQALSPRRERKDRPASPTSPGQVEDTEGPGPAAEDHPGRQQLKEDLKRLFAGDKRKANAWILEHAEGRSWSQLTAEDLQHLLDLVASSESDQVDQAAPQESNQDAEARRRKAAQKAWGIAAGKCGLTEAEVYWYMGEAFGWVHDPGKGRPSANATPIPQIEAAIHALNSLSPEEVDKVRQDYAFWLDDQNRPEADQ